jgi:hypothetical protein
MKLNRAGRGYVPMAHGEPKDVPVPSLFIVHWTIITLISLFIVIYIY